MWLDLKLQCRVGLSSDSFHREGTGRIAPCQCRKHEPQCVSPSTSTFDLRDEWPDNWALWHAHVDVLPGRRGAERRQYPACDRVLQAEVAGAPEPHLGPRPQDERQLARHGAEHVDAGGEAP